MAYRRKFRRSGGRYRKYGRGVNKRQRLITGKSPLSAPERLLASGAPYIKLIPSLVRTVGQFASMINSEVHYKDTTYVPTTTNTGEVVLLSGIAQGDGDTTRTGNSILGKDLYVRWSAVKNAAASSTYLRMIVICDKEFDGVLPVVNEILSSSDYQAMINQDFSKRFVILRDYTINLNSSQSNRVGKFYTKIPFHIHYDNTGSSLTSCKENQLLILTISNEATNAPGVSFSYRLKWYDN